MRRVFLCGNHVIKIPRLSNWKAGLAANRAEIAWSARGYPGYCPVVSAHPTGFWLVMPRCRVMTDHDMTEVEFDKFFDQFGKEALDGSGTPVSLPHLEAKPSNFGWFEGRWVAIDYGA